MRDVRPRERRVGRPIERLPHVRYLRVFNGEKWMQTARFEFAQNTVRCLPVELVVPQRVTSAVEADRAAVLESEEHGVGGRLARDERANVT